MRNNLLLAGAASLLLSVLVCNVQAKSSEIGDLRARVDDLTKKLQEFGGHPKSGFETIASGRSVTAHDHSVTLTFHGYVRLDMLYTAEQIGDLESFTTATIPVESAEGVKGINGDYDYVHASRQVYFNAKRTRFGMSADKQLKDSALKIFIEGDFWGAGKFRLRHAYGELSGISVGGGEGLVIMGQTTSTFTVTASSVETLDFEGPNSNNIADRHELARWRHQLSGWFTYQLGLENNQYDISQSQVNVSGVDIEVREYESTFPMVVSAFILGGDNNNIQFSAAYSRLKARITLHGIESDKVIDGYALNMGGVFALGESDKLRYYGVYSKGLGLLLPDLDSGFAGGVAGLNAEETKILTLDSYGGMLALEHFWTQKWISNVVWGYVNVDNTADQLEWSFKSSNYVAANLLWKPTKQFMFGAEYLYGDRENKSGYDGTASRVQLAAQFNF